MSVSIYLNAYLDIIEQQESKKKRTFNAFINLCIRIVGSVVVGNSNVLQKFHRFKTVAPRYNHSNRTPSYQWQRFAIQQVGQKYGWFTGYRLKCFRVRNGRSKNLARVVVVVAPIINATAVFNRATVPQDSRKGHTLPHALPKR